MRIFLTGGFVRNNFLKVAPGKDYDFAMEAKSYDAMREWLLDMGMEPYLERPEFVTIRGRILRSRLGNFGTLLPAMNPEKMIDVDFTLCRAEAMYHDNRHPSSVTPTDIYKDLSRRDFTINAIAVTEDGGIADPYDGINDCHNRILRCVGSANDRFIEDPLRILRAIRFAVKYNLNIQDDTRSAINFVAGSTDLLSKLPVERIREELVKAFSADWGATMFALVHTFPALGTALRKHHPNLWFKPTTEDR